MDLNDVFLLMKLDGMRTVFCSLIPLFLIATNIAATGDDAVDKQLQTLLKRFPKADANKDGRLTVQEACLPKKPPEGIAKAACSNAVFRKPWLEAGSIS